MPPGSIIQTGPKGNQSLFRSTKGCNKKESFVLCDMSKHAHSVLIMLGYLVNQGKRAKKNIFHILTSHRVLFVNLSRLLWRDCDLKILSQCLNHNTILHFLTVGISFFWGGVFIVVFSNLFAETTLQTVST